MPSSACPLHFKLNAMKYKMDIAKVKSGKGGKSSKLLPLTKQTSLKCEEYAKRGYCGLLW